MKVAVFFALRRLVGAIDATDVLVSRLKPGIIDILPRRGNKIATFMTHSPIKSVHIDHKSPVLSVFRIGLRESGAAHYRVPHAHIYHSSYSRLAHQARAFLIIVWKGTQESD